MTKEYVRELEARYEKAVAEDPGNLAAQGRLDLIMDWVSQFGKEGG